LCKDTNLILKNIKTLKKNIFPSIDFLFPLGGIYVQGPETYVQGLWTVVYGPWTGVSGPET